jgi:hypothetical protein
MKNYSAVLFIACFIFSLSFFSYGQSQISFIRLNSYIGYVIDSTENDQCSCVNYSGKKFSYGSLVQLADSEVVMRVKMHDRETFADIPMSRKDVEQLSARAANAQMTVSDDKAENELIKKLAGDSVSFRLTDYFDLKFKTVPAAGTATVIKGTSFDYTYFEAGIGLTNRAGKNLYYAFGVNVGTVFNKNILSGRVWVNKEHESLFGEVKPKEYIVEIALMYGRMFPVDRVAFSVNAGIGYSTGVLKGRYLYGGNFLTGTATTYESKNFETIGIPLKAELLVGTKRKSIASFAVVANVNAVYVYYGLLISLRISNENRPAGK